MLSHVPFARVLFGFPAQTLPIHSGPCFGTPEKHLRVCVMDGLGLPLKAPASGLVSNRQLAGVSAKRGSEWVMHAKSGYTAYRVPVATAADYYHVQKQARVGHQDWLQSGFTEVHFAWMFEL